jgi:hypothetical protein
MITKLLLTAFVIGIVYLLAKKRAQGMPGAPPSRRDMTAAALERQPTPRLPRLLAYSLLVIMLGASAVFIFLQWREQYSIVTILVVNTNTGGSVTYQARRGDVTDRSFNTTDGRRVVLAAVERMELSDR